MSMRAIVGWAAAYIAITSIIVMSAAQRAKGQCPGGVCIIPERGKATQGYVWRDGGRSCESALYRGSKQVGAFCHRRQVFLPYDAATGVWGEQTAPPIPAPLPKQTEEPPVIGQMCDEPEENFGIDCNKLKSPLQPLYKINGVPVSREDCRQAMSRGLPDDAGKLWLTIIGSKEERDKVMADIPPDVKSAVRLNSYAPSDWPVKDAGFVTSGHPTIYLQAPDGKTIHRQDDYRGVGDFEAIRRAVKDYDPKKDRDMRNPAPGGNTNMLFVIGGVAALVIFLLKRGTT